MRRARRAASAASIAVCTGLACSVAHGQGGRANRPLDIYFVDVEGGAATLTVTPAGESFLVDCGWPGEEGRDAKRIEHVARNVAGLSRIDHFIATHWHTDHYGGIEPLAQRIPIGQFHDHGVPESLSDDPNGFQTLIAAYKRANGGKSHAVKPGDLIRLRNAGMPLELKVVAGDGKVVGEGSADLPISCARHASAPVVDESDNKRSLGLLLKWGQFKFLNCGDLTWNIEHKLVCPENRLGAVDLFQVTHHGAPQSGNPALIEAIQPRCAVICNGPKKGGDPRTYAALRKTGSIEAIYQLHRNVNSSPMDNAPLAQIANPAEKCQGEFIHVRVEPSGKSYSVAFGQGRPLRTFQVTAK